MMAKNQNSNQASMAVICLALFSLLGIIYGMITNNADIQAGFIFFVVGCFVLFIMMSGRDTIDTPVLFGFLIRMAICLYYTYIGDGDADYYGVYATSFANMSIEDVITNIPTGAYLYSWIISFSFRLFGEVYMPIRALNCILSVVSIAVVADTVDIIYGEEVITRKAAWLMALFPNLVRFSSLFANREVFILLFMCLYLKYSALFYRYFKLHYLIISIVVLIPAMILHTSMIVMIICTALIILSMPTVGKNQTSSIIVKFILLCVAGGAFALMLVNGVGMEKLSLSGSELTIESVSNIGTMSAAGRAAYLQGVSFSNPVLTILFVPVRILFFLYTPFVWMIRAKVDIAGFFDAILYLWVSVSIFKKLKVCLRYNDRTEEEKLFIILLITLLCIVTMFATVTSNYGTAIRHRCKLFPFFLILCVDTIRIPFKIGRLRGD